MFSFVSTSVFGLVSIPVAVHYLSREEIGLWASVNAMVSYLMWMDLGVGNSTGRKMADAVVAGDPEQINTWWTATQLSLWVLGGMTVLIGFCLLPLFGLIFNIPSDLKGNANILLIGVVICGAVNFPLRGVPGLLAAQERFHWVPICQGIAPWVQLIVFYTALKNGTGIVSYVYATAAMQLFSFMFYRGLVRFSHIRPRYNKKGVSKKHIKELFGFSLGVAVVGLKEAFLNTLPVIILARTTGLQSVPVWAFSNRLPGMMRSLATRINHAYLPEMINLHVAGRHEFFLLKFKRSILFTSAVSLFSAGFVLLANKSIVTILAGDEFYAGDDTTMWFATLLVAGTLSAVCQGLLQISGNMGKSVAFSIFNVLIVGTAAVVANIIFGMSGLAAVFALQPVLYGAYGFLRGAKNCGYSIAKFFDFSMWVALASIASAIAVGCLVDSGRPIHESILFFGKTVIMPSTSQIIGALALVGFGGIVGWIGVSKTAQ